MSEWIARVTYKSRIENEIRVQGADYMEAFQAAQRAAEAAAPPGYNAYADVIRQEGEPWLKHVYVCKGAEPTTVVCERALGHAFTEADVDLLKKRLTAYGWTVVRHWNGVGYSSLSIGCAEHFDWGGRDCVDMEKAIAHLLSKPRPSIVPPIQACGAKMPVMGFACTEPAGHDDRHRCERGSWPKGL